MAHDRTDHPVPGRWHGRLSLRPARELLAFILGADNYTKELRAQAGSSVFKAHPGIRSTMVTDMAGMEYVFRAPPEALDRLETPGFGGLALNHQELLGGAIPALVSRGAGDRPARLLIDEVMKLRRHAFAPACQATLDHGPAMLSTAAPGVEVDLKEALNEAAVGTAFAWLFGIRPGPTGRQSLEFQKGLFGFASDAPLAHALARRFYRAKNGPREETRRYARDILAAVRGCEPYPDFVAAARRVGVPEEEVAAHVLFVASMNTTAGAWATLYPAVAQVFVDRRVRDRLVAELGDFHGDIWALGRLPYLHDFYLETLRLFGRPRHYYRRVMVDLALPRSLGAPVPIPAGATLCVVATVARQDPTVWGDDASIFDPERYTRNPSLRDRVYPLGPPAGANTFGCAGAAGGLSSTLWKCVAAPTVRARDWRLSPWPVPDVNAFDGVRPSTLAWVRS
jgi:cytochrome P450